MFLTVDDLTPFGMSDDAKTLALIADVEAQAKQVAPCLKTVTLDDDQTAFVKSVLRAIVLRWNDTGAGALASSTHMAGSVSVTETMDTRNGAGRTLWKSEIVKLVDLCRSLSTTQAATMGELDTLPTTAVTATARLGFRYESSLTGYEYYASDLGYLDEP